MGTYYLPTIIIILLLLILLVIILAHTPHSVVILFAISDSVKTINFLRSTPAMTAVQIYILYNICVYCKT